MADGCAHKQKGKDSIVNPYAVCTSSADQECEAKTPFQEAFEGKPKESATGSGMASLTRGGVKK